MKDPRHDYPGRRQAEAAMARINAHAQALAGRQALCCAPLAVGVQAPDGVFSDVDATAPCRLPAGHAGVHRP